MKSHSHTKGFTLIELLVVIAIIGILASVVLASLNTARDKGTDAAVKSNLTGLKSQAAIYNDDNSGDFSLICDDPKIADAVEGSKLAVAPTVTSGGLGDGDCASSATEWAAWVNLKSASTTAFCVDSTGVSSTTPAQNSSTPITLCP